MTENLEKTVQALRDVCSKDGTSNCYEGTQKKLGMGMVPRLECLGHGQKILVRVRVVWPSALVEK